MSELSGEEKVKIIETVYSILNDKFEYVPKSVGMKISSYNEDEILYAIIRDAASAKDIDEFYTKLISYKKKE